MRRRRLSICEDEVTEAADDDECKEDDVADPVSFLRAVFRLAPETVDVGIGFDGPTPVRVGVGPGASRRVDELPRLREPRELAEDGVAVGAALVGVRVPRDSGAVLDGVLE